MNAVSDVELTAAPTYKHAQHLFFPPPAQRAVCSAVLFMTYLLHNGDFNQAYPVYNNGHLVLISLSWLFVQGVCDVQAAAVHA